MGNTILVDNIRFFCRKKGTSVTRMEMKLGFSQGLISRWAKMSPSIDKIVEVADYLQVSLDDLMGRAGNGRESRLGQKLCERTRTGKIIWIPYRYNGRRLPFDYPIEALPELENVDWEGWYCRYLTGFFVLVAIKDMDEQAQELELYAIPGEGSLPQKQNVKEELFKLWEFVSQGDISSAETERASDFVESFLNENGDDEI